MSKTFQVIDVLNPFDPRDHVRSDRDWTPGKTIDDLFPPIAYKGELTVSVNGRIVESEERSRVYVQAGDSVVICPVVLGGGGGGGSGKMILKIVAMIALAVVTMGAGLAIAAAIGFTGTALTVAGAVIQMGIMVAGGMLVNSILAPPKPDKAPETERGFGIDNAKNTSEEGLPVPVAYGTTRFAGNVINNYIVNDGDTQWLYILINCGEGEVDDITDIEVNGQPLSEFKDVDVVTRSGMRDQSPMTWFLDSIVPYSIGHKLTQDFHVYTTKGVVDKLRIDLSAPQGLLNIEGKGDELSVSVPLDIEIRKAGTTLWQRMPGGDYISTEYEYETRWAHVPSSGYGWNTGIETTEQYVPTGNEYLEGDDYYVRETDGTLGRKVGTRVPVGIYSSTYQISGRTRNPLRRSYMSLQLEEAVYDVRVRRRNAEKNKTDSTETDIVYWTDINEITLEDVALNHTALLGVRIRLSDQLDGMPTITHVNKGRKIMWFNEATKTWDYGASSNPAWIALDILTNKRFGGGTSRDRFDISVWREWARHCDAQKLEFNGVFSSKGNVWDAVQAVVRCGHAQLIRVGTRYTVAIERASEPVMMFSAGNIVQGSFSESWLSTAERINTIEAKYLDRDDNWKERTIRMSDRAAIAAGQPERTTQVEMTGVTSAQQVWNDLAILLNMNRYIKRTVEFAASLDAIACTIGDVILVQHDMPKWGEGGRIEALSTTSVVNLDKDVTMEAGKTYSLLVHYPALKRAEGVVSSVVTVAGESVVSLRGWDGRQRVDRIRVADRELPILGTTQINGENAVTVDGVGVIPVGSTYELFTIDAVETRNVVNLAVTGFVTGTQLTMAIPFPDAPPQFAVYMFGETTKVAKPFRVKSIKGSHDHERTISAMEYNATVYDPAGAVPTPNYSGLSSAVQHATITGVKEITGVDGKTTVTVSFDSAQQTYRKSLVAVSLNGGRFEDIGQDLYSVNYVAARGDKLVFRVVAMDTFGNLAPSSTAPTSEYTVTGANPLLTPTKLKLTVYTGDTRRFEWVYPTANTAGLAGFEARYFVGYGVPKWEDMTRLFEASAIERSRETTLPPNGGVIVAIRAMNLYGDVGTEARSYFYIRGTAAADDPTPTPIPLPAPEEGKLGGVITLLIPTTDPSEPYKSVMMLLPTREAPTQVALTVSPPSGAGLPAGTQIRVLVPKADLKFPTGLATVLFPKVTGQPQRGYSLVLPALDAEALNKPITLNMPRVSPESAPIIPVSLTPYAGAGPQLESTVLAQPASLSESFARMTVLLPIIDLISQQPNVPGNGDTTVGGEPLISNIEGIEIDGVVRFSVAGIDDPALMGYVLKEGPEFGSAEVLLVQTGKDFELPALGNVGKVFWVAGLYSTGAVTARRWKLNLATISTVGPSGLSWKIIEPEIVFTWNELPGAARYRVFLESGGITQWKEVFNGREARFAIPKYNSTFRVMGVSSLGQVSSPADEEIAVLGSYSYNEIYSANIDVRDGKFVNMAFVDDGRVRRVSVKGSDAVAPYVEGVNDSDLFAFIHNLKPVPISAIKTVPLNWFRKDFWKNKSGFFESPIVDFGLVLTGRLILAITKTVTAAGPAAISTFKDVQIRHISDSSPVELSDQKALVSARFIVSSDGESWKEVAYGDWVTARYVQAVAAVEMASPLTEVNITAGKFTIDVPDITESGSMSSVTNSGKVLTFAKTYNKVTSVVATARGAARVHTTDLTDFSVRLVTDSATPTAVDYFVKGY